MVPNDIQAAVSPVFSQYRVPDYIWQSIAAMETGGSFDPRALGDNGASFGLFQLYTRGGQGDSYAGNPEQLYDPRLNAQVAAPEIARAYYLGKSLGMGDGPDLAAFTAANSGHPGYNLPMTDPAVSRVATYAKDYAGVPATSPAGAPLSIMYGIKPDGSAMTAGDWWSQVKGQFGQGNISNGVLGYFNGFNSDGSPRGWFQYGDSALPKEAQPDPGMTVGEWAWGAGKEKAKEAVKEAVSKAASDSPWSPEFWKRAGLYVAIVGLAAVLITASVRAVTTPQN